MNEPLPPEVFCQQVPSVAEYVTAFRDIEPEMGEHHFRSCARTTTPWTTP